MSTVMYKGKYYILIKLSDTSITDFKKNLGFYHVHDIERGKYYIVRSLCD